MPAASSAEIGNRAPDQCGHDRGRFVRLPDVGHEPAHPHELQRPSGEGEVVAGPEPGDEILLHRAERAPAEELHLHRGLAHDRADREPMPHRHHPVGDDVAPVPHDHLAVLGIGSERVAAVGDEVQHPRPLGPGQAAVGVGRADLVVQLVRQEAAAERDGDGVLRQQIERPLDRPARLDPARLERVARRGHVHQLEGVGGHAGEAADGARLVAAAAGALDQPPDRLGAAHLQHAIDRREVHAEVEGRGADDAAQLALAEAILDPFASPPVERAVVQGHDAGPVGPGGQQRLIPDLRCGPRVGEHERALPFLDGGHHLRQEPKPDLPGPREALHRLRG